MLWIICMHFFSGCKCNEILSLWFYCNFILCSSPFVLLFSKFMSRNFLCLMLELCSYKPFGLLCSWFYSALNVLWCHANKPCLNKKCSKSSCLQRKIQFVSVPWPVGSSGGTEGRFSRDPLPVCSTEGHRRHFRFIGMLGRLHFDVVLPAFPLPPAASPALQRALKDGLGEAVVSGCSNRNEQNWPAYVSERNFM